MKLTNEQREITQKYGHLFVNTGGNDPIELMEREDINFHNNYVATSLQIACQSQLVLLQKLIALFPETSTDEQLADACMWLRHDFGLLDEEDRRAMMVSMRENWRAIWKACNTPGRGGQYAPAPAH